MTDKELMHPNFTKYYKVYCPSCEAKVGEMCKPYINRKSKHTHVPPHILRGRKYYRDLASGEIKP